MTDNISELTCKFGIDALSPFLAEVTKSNKYEIMYKIVRKFIIGRSSPYLLHFTVSRAFFDEVGKYFPETVIFAEFALEMERHSKLKNSHIVSAGMSENKPGYPFEYFMFAIRNYKITGRDYTIE
jgi:hypothetical protein